MNIRDQCNRIKIIVPDFRVFARLMGHADAAEILMRSPRLFTLHAV